MSNIALILNPQAGKGKARRLLPVIEKKLRAQGLVFEVFETSGPGHATELARSLVQSGIDMVIAAGGDGTVREVAGGIHGTTAILGVLPLGSGNDFIKSVGIPKDLDAACALLAGGKVRTIDLVRIGTTCLANAVGVGFDALVVVEANRMRWLQGLALYVAAVLKATLNYTCPRTTIELDGIRLEKPILLIACANGEYYGGGFHIAPGAKVDDGLLDVCVIDAVSRLRILHKLTYVIKGTHAQLPEVEFYRTRKVRLSSPDILYVQADGDLLPEADPHQLEIEILPLALKVIALAQA